MDWITQAALGAWIGEWMMGKRLGRRALAWGAFFGLLPGLLESSLFLFLETSAELAVQGGLAHSPLVIGAGSWAIAGGLARLWKREKISRKEALTFVFAVWCAHVAADMVTTEGAAPGWPFSLGRVSLDLLHAPDLFFTVPLLVGLAGMVFLKEAKAKKSRGKKPVPLTARRKLTRWTLGMGGAYLVLALVMKWAAGAGFAGDLARRGADRARTRISPVPHGIFLWRAVVDRGDALWVGYRTPFEPRATPVRWTIYPKHADSLARVADLRETKRLMEISAGWWIARSHAKGAWLGDMRFPESRVWGARKGTVDSRLAASWLIQQEAEGDPLRLLAPEARERPEFFRRMGRRILGQREMWEGNPRLAGVAGRLPEFLPVEE